MKFACLRLSKENEMSDSTKINVPIANAAAPKSGKADFERTEDTFKVDFHYYEKQENSQPITTKSMQSLYQGLEDRAKETYIRLRKAEEYAVNYVAASKNEDVTSGDLRELYDKHIHEMNAPLAEPEIITEIDAIAAEPEYLTPITDEGGAVITSERKPNNDNATHIMEAELKPVMASITELDNKKSNAEDLFKVNFHYYVKPESSQPITTKSMQALYQGLEDSAKQTYIRLRKAEEYASMYIDANKNKDLTGGDLRGLYNNHIKEMNSL